MKKLDKICIVGLGLIGGSIGLAARERRIARKVYGLVRRRSAIAEARRGKVVDTATMDPEEAVSGAEIIIIATPISSMERIAASIKPYLTTGTIVSDVASSKRQVVQQLEKNFYPGIRFVGAHPIAGSEQRGMSAARGDLFEGTPCVVTPTPRTDKSAFLSICKFWEALGARVYLLPPQEHDRILAMVSHLPHLLAATLVNCASRTRPRSGNIFDYTGTGFRDVTRIAASPADLWVDILMSNRDEILRSLKLLSDEAKRVRRLIERADAAGIRRVLTRAGQLRRKIS